MRLVDTSRYDDWLTKDLPNDEPLTEDEQRQERENERDSRWIEEMFR
jgi:hypothetical protein